MGPIETKASQFATACHGLMDQRRKYTNDPYIVHPKAVAAILRELRDPAIGDEELAAAWLHDVMEDCGVSKETLIKEFGFRVADLVDQLTDVSVLNDGNRATRKALDREHLSRACPAAKTIKLADMIDNTASITGRDPKFEKVYFPEKRLLLGVLKEGNATLWNFANSLLELTGY